MTRRKHISSTQKSKRNRGNKGSKSFNERKPWHKPTSAQKRMLKRLRKRRQQRFFNKHGEAMPDPKEDWWYV